MHLILSLLFMVKIPNYKLELYHRDAFRDIIADSISNIECSRCKRLYHGGPWLRPRLTLNKVMFARHW